ncbi:hypothetical protein HK098_001789 [Nowakowskiella sp. JEL0407]|nr:hypothetical protein HK098_001785 [Nowakowskiella sp. JEL0407]KAJ3123621.1 hypothetical protein HK098_001789 [Nowakowskiella sp. JEL0407]
MSTVSDTGAFGIETAAWKGKSKVIASWFTSPVIAGTVVAATFLIIKYGVFGKKHSLKGNSIATAQPTSNDQRRATASSTRETVSKDTVFLSYAWANSSEQLQSQAVGFCDPRRIARSLRSEFELTIWMDIEKLVPGQSLFDSLADALYKVAAVSLVCVSNAYSKSENCRRELSFMAFHKIPFISLIVGDENETEWTSTGIGFLVLNGLYVDMRKLKSISEERKCLDQIYNGILDKAKDIKRKYRTPPTIYAETHTDDVLECRPEFDSVHCLKKCIDQAMGLSIDQQRIIFGRKLLMNDQSLSSYGILDGSTVQVTKYMVGGGSGTNELRLALDEIWKGNIPKGITPSEVSALENINKSSDPNILSLLDCVNNKNEFEMSDFRGTWTTEVADAYLLLEKFMALKWSRNRSKREMNIGL